MFENLNKIRDSFDDFFFEVRDGEATLIEHELGIVFPETLKILWGEFGYFFVRQGVEDDKRSYQKNRLLTPIEIKGLIEGKDVGFSSPPGERVEGGVPFFAASSTACLQTKLDDTGVYWFDDLVAENLEQFIEKISLRADFYLD